MKNIVISLATALDRRTHICQEFGKQGIDFEFFDAVSFADIDAVCDRLGFDNIKQTHHLANGEKGCFLSHLSLWQKMLDDDIEWLAIFEDDVHLGGNAHLFLNRSDWLSGAFGLVKIEHFYPKLHLSKAIASHHGREIYPLLSANLGTAGYIIHKNTANHLLKILKNISTDDIIAIDHFMFAQMIENQSIFIAQLSPALCIQSDRLDPNTALVSDINAERRARMDSEKQKRTLLQKVKREFGRVFKQINQDKDLKQMVEFR